MAAQTRTLETENRALEARLAALKAQKTTSEAQVRVLEARLAEEAAHASLCACRFGCILLVVGSAWFGRTADLFSQYW